MQQRKNECADIWAHITPLEKAIEELRDELKTVRSSRQKLLDELCYLRPSEKQKSNTPIPVVIGVDIEPDKRAVDLADPSWQGAKKFFEKLPAFRQRLQEVSHQKAVPLSWFPRADPQIKIANGDASWALKEFAGEWQSASDTGDEIGLHMHPWRWNEEQSWWSQDHGDEDWVCDCLHSSLAAYRDYFKKSPTSYRGGDRFLSQAVVEILETEGVLVDLTLERMPAVQRLVEAEHGSGSLPDGTTIPNRAFRPSTTDFTQADPKKSAGLGMLPLTAYAKGSLSPWLPNTLFDHELQALLDSSERPSHLAFVVRADIADAPSWDHFVENAQSLARAVRRGQLVFTTAAQAWQMAAPQG